MGGGFGIGARICRLRLTSPALQADKQDEARPALLERRRLDDVLANPASAWQGEHGRGQHERDRRSPNGYAENLAGIGGEGVHEALGSYIGWCIGQ